MALLTGLLAGGSLLSGILGHNSRRKAQKRQEKLQEKQLDLSEQEFAVRMQERQRWKELYGGVEENLLHYVKSLDADTLYGQSEGGLRKTFDIARQNMESHLAMRGFDVAGGIHAGMFTELALKEAELDMQYRAKAQQYVAQQQQALLTHNPMPNAPSTAGMQNVLSQMGNTAQAWGRYQDNEFSSLGSFLGNIAGGMYGDKSSTNQPVMDIFKSLTGY